jgi:hypothetical protein
MLVGLAKEDPSQSSESFREPSATGPDLSTVGAAGGVDRTLVGREPIANIALCDEVLEITVAFEVPSVSAHNAGVAVDHVDSELREDIAACSQQENASFPPHVRDSDEQVSGKEMKRIELLAQVVNGVDHFHVKSLHSPCEPDAHSAYGLEERLTLWQLAPLSLASRLLSFLCQEKTVHCST